MNQEIALKFGYSVIYNLGDKDSIITKILVGKFLSSDRFVMYI